MAAPTPSWNLVRCYATWHNLDGTLKAGTYKVTVPVRITNATDDVIIPAGIALQGDLQTADPEVPSLDVMVPATDDPDNSETDWLLEVEVSFQESIEKYVFEVPLANRPVEDGGNGEGVNLREVVLTESIPQQVPLYKVNQPNGLAGLDGSGFIDLDALPAGSVVATETTTRPTARDDLTVLFLTESSPEGQLDGDLWWSTT